MMHTISMADLSMADLKPRYLEGRGPSEFEMLAIEVLDTLDPVSAQIHKLSHQSACTDTADLCW